MNGGDRMERSERGRQTWAARAPETGLAQAIRLVLQWTEERLQRNQGAG